VRGLRALPSRGLRFETVTDPDDQRSERITLERSWSSSHGALHVVVAVNVARGSDNTVLTPGVFSKLQATKQGPTYVKDEVPGHIR
jgi:hypothetical protein